MVATLFITGILRKELLTLENKEQKRLKDLNKQRTLAQQPQPQPRDDNGSLGHLKTKRKNGKIPPA